MVQPLVQDLTAEALGSSAAAGGLVALIMGMFVFFVIFVIVAYIYSAITLMIIANKTKTPNSWLAWIPIANIVLMLQVAGLPWWYVFAILVGFIPFLGSIALMAGGVYVWWLISEKRGFPGWYGIMMLIPIVNFIFMGILAWSEPK
jgi:hypothetical protein